MLAECKATCMQAAAHNIMQADGIKGIEASWNVWQEVSNGQGDVQVLFVYLAMLVLYEHKHSVMLRKIIAKPAKKKSPIHKKLSR